MRKNAQLDRSAGMEIKPIIQTAEARLIALAAELGISITDVANIGIMLAGRHQDVPVAPVPVSAPPVPEPTHYNRQQLAERAGISIRTLADHEAKDVGKMLSAREKVPGVGLVYKASGVRRYLGLCAAGCRKPKAKRPPGKAEA